MGLVALPWQQFPNDEIDVESDASRFPIDVFCRALSENTSLEKLTVKSVGLIDDQADRLLCDLPNQLEHLDLQCNRLRSLDFRWCFSPKRGGSGNRQSDYRLRSLCLWPNPCFRACDLDDEERLEFLLSNILSLLDHYPSLWSLGRSWATFCRSLGGLQKMQKPHNATRSTERNRNTSCTMEQIQSLMDLNRCNFRWVRSSLRFEPHEKAETVEVMAQKLWPYVLSKANHLFEKEGDHSELGMKARSANTLFHLLLDSRGYSSGGILLFS